MNTIWLIEDDPTQAADIAQGLGAEFDAEVKRIPTELEFRQRFDDILASNPRVVVIDLLLRWTDPSEDMEPFPPDVDPNKGFLTAGLRCQQRLTANPRTRDVPIVIYTIVNGHDSGVDPNSLPKNARFIRKESNYSNLFDSVKQLTGV